MTRGRKVFNQYWGRMNDVRDDIYNAIMELSDINGSCVSVAVSVELLNEQGSDIKRMSPTHKWSNVKIEHITQVLDEETFTLKPVKVVEELEKIEKKNLYTWMQHVQTHVSAVLKIAEEGQAIVSAEVKMSNGKKFVIVRHEDVEIMVVEQTEEIVG